MNMHCRWTLKATAVSCALLSMAIGLDRANAQDTSARLPASVAALIELAPETLSQFIQRLSGSELVTTLIDATTEERTALVVALSEEDRATLLTSLAQAGAVPGMLADIITAMIVADAESAGRVIDLVAQDTPAEVLPPLAEGMMIRVAGGCSLFEQTALNGLVLATLSFNTGIAEQIVQFGNTADDGCATALARSLAVISVTADDAIASAIEVALAIEGGVMVRLVAELRGEVAVAATPQPFAPLPPAPIVAPAGVGGAGSVPGSTPGTGAGEDAIFAQNGRGGGFPNGGAGGTLSSASPGADVSPAN